jgi:hypothetical protein
MTVPSLCFLSAKVEAERQMQLKKECMNTHELPVACLYAIEIIKRLNLDFEHDIDKAHQALNIEHHYEKDYMFNIEIALYFFIKSLDHLTLQQKEDRFRNFLISCINSNNIIAFKKVIELIKNRYFLNLNNILIFKEGEKVHENLLYDAAKNGSVEILDFIYKLNPNLINLNLTLTIILIDHNLGTEEEEIKKIPILRYALEDSRMNKYSPYNCKNIEYLLSLQEDVIYLGAIHESIYNANPKALRSILVKNPHLINQLQHLILPPIDCIDFEGARFGNEIQIEMIMVCYEFKEYIANPDNKLKIEQAYQDIVKRKADYDNFSDDEIKKKKPTGKKPNK